MEGFEVGVIGVGEMGRPMVERLLAAGHRVTALVRRRGQQQKLRELGVNVVKSVAALAAGRQFVILFVYSDDDARKIALDDGLIAAMAPGAVLISHTTGSPLTVEAIAERARDRSVRVIDAPVSGGPARIASGTITLLVGGDTFTVDSCRALFAAYADPVLHMGPLGSGQRVKLINNILVGANIQLALEAQRLAKGFGIDEQQLTRALGQCSGGSAVIDVIAQMGSVDRLIATGGRFVEKDVLVARDVAAQLGAELGLLNLVTDPLLARIKSA